MSGHGEMGGSWPSGPPPMPPPGWYDDPEQSSTWRWWDGARWTALRSPMWVAPIRDPRSFSAWFDRSVACVKAVVRRLGIALLLLWLAVMALSGVLFATLWNSGRGAELRDLLEVETGAFGSGTTATLDLTSVEVDRIWELLRQLLWVAVPGLVALGLIGAVASLMSVAAVARVARAHIENADGLVDESLLATIIASSRRIPALLASTLIVVCIGWGPFVVAGLFVLAVVLAGGATAAIVLVALFALSAASVLAFWLWGRLSLAIAITAIGGHGLGIRRSWELTDGHFWPTIGRLIVAGLIASVVTAPVSMVNSFAFALGPMAFLIMWLALQALAVTASSMISTSAQIAIVDQLSHQLSEV